MIRLKGFPAYSFLVYDNLPLVFRHRPAYPKPDKKEANHSGALTNGWRRAIMNIVQLRKRGGCGQHGGDVERSDYENLPGYGVRTGPVRPGHAFGRKGVPCGARVALQLLSLEGRPGHRDHRERLKGYFQHGA